MGRISNFFKAIGRGIVVGTNWLSRKLTDFKILILSVLIMSAYVILVYAGVINQNRLLIVLSGIAASLCFCVIVFLALERPSLFGGLIARVGFTLTNGKWKAKDKKQMRGLWFFAVAPLFFTFWLAMFPTQAMGFISIVATLCLFTLFLIGFWQKIPSGFWKAYYNFGKKAFPVIIVLVFVVYAPFNKFWDGLAKFVVTKSEQAVAWFASPSKTADEKTEKQKNGKIKISSPPRRMTQNAPPVSGKKAAKTATPVSKQKQGGRRVVAPAEDDDLSRAAEAGLPAFDQMRRELAELNAPKSVRKSAALQRRRGANSASPIKMPDWAK